MRRATAARLADASSSRATEILHQASMTDPNTITKHAPADLPEHAGRVPHYWVKGIAGLPIVEREIMDRALEQSGLSREQLARKRGTVPEESEIQLIESLAALTGNRNIGAELGLAHDPRFGSILVYLLFCSATFGQAMKTISHFVSLARPNSVVEVTASKDQVRIALSSRRPHVHLAQHYIEFVVGALIKNIRTATGENRMVKDVCLRTPRKTGALELAEIYGCPVTLGAERTEIGFHPWELERPILSADDMLLAHLTSFGEMLLSHRRKIGATFSGQVKYAVLKQIGQGAPTLQRTAALLGLGERTLSRRLAESGQSFREVADQARQHLAESYLADPALTIAEIAYLLGYVDQSSFGTAFRRWTGTSPGRFRQNLRD
ncbi:MAG: AraC family transcriptional regulator ligand-binding domain-containing protein [Pseudomonadota bacterium]